MSVASSVRPLFPFISDIVYLCLLCIILCQCPQDKSGFRDHFPLWVLIFLPHLPWLFLTILSGLYCFEEEAFKILSSIFICF